MAKLVRACPQCGNQVESEIKRDFTHKVVRTAAVRGTSYLIGLAVDAAVPGVGNVAREGINILFNTLLDKPISKSLDYLEENVLGNGDKEFSCPNCGLRWYVPKSELRMQLASTVEYAETLDKNSFQYFWQEYFQKQNEIFESPDKINNYVQRLSKQYSDSTSSDTVNFLFLQSFAILHYSIERSSDELLEEGLSYLMKAQTILDDDELNILHLIYEIRMVDNEDIERGLDDYYSFEEELDYDCLDNNLVTLDYWKELYKNCYEEMQLLMGISLYDSGNEDEGIKLIQWTKSTSDSWTHQIVADSYICSYYSQAGEEFEHIVTESAIHTVEEVVGDFEFDFDPNDFVNNCWLNCLSHCATAYIDGSGVNADLVKGLRYANFAAKLGSAEAMLTLADCYNLNDGGCKTNYSLAMDWYIKAAEKDESYAMYRIAEMYEEGKGVPVDIECAVFWYKKAGENGYDSLYLPPTTSEKIERLKQVSLSKKNTGLY